MPKKTTTTDGAPMTRAQAVQAATDRYQKTKRIDPVIDALLSKTERLSVLIGKPYETYAKRTKRELALLSVEQRNALDADLHTGMTFGEIAAKHNVPASAVSAAFLACYKTRSYKIRVR